jgi:hypothetical protein
VKRGYWVVRRVLGETIPPPPAVVPELPRDEAKLELPLRDMLAKHREDASCSACHARFDSFGLALEGYGPIGEQRVRDLGGRLVDTHATFPGGREGTGIDGLRRYLNEYRRQEFIDNLKHQMLTTGSQAWKLLRHLQAALAGNELAHDRVGGRPNVRCGVEEERKRTAQRSRQQIEATSAHSVGSRLILLHLLERHAKQTTEFLL